MRWLTLLSLLLWALPAARADGVLVVRHNLTAQQNAVELSYEEELLTLVLEKSRSRFGPYVLRAVRGLSQGRAFRELDAGHVDVLSTMTDNAREQQALPVRYCLYRGLLGVRIGVGLPATVARLNGVRNEAELRSASLGQVFDWPDYEIQRQAGLNVIKLNDFASGLSRLQMGTFDLLPLGVVEASPIAQAHGLALINGWAIAYPTAYYFFVNRNNHSLAQRLAYGFDEAIRDHSFDALFAKRIEPLLRAAQLDKRLIIRLKNPLLPTATPQARDELWHPLARSLFQD